MVRRSDRAVGGTARKRAGAGDPRAHRGRRRGDDDEALAVQERGVLNRNNPLIPPELDEDIDDDFAFNSDDEEKYGHLFRKATTTDAATAKGGAKQRKGTKAKKASKHADDDTDDALVLQQLRALGEIEDDDDLDFHDGRGAGRRGGKDDDDYIDLADMLDAGQEEEERRSKDRKKKTKKKIDESGVAKKRRRALLTEEAESIYGQAAAAAEGTYSSTLRQIVSTAPDSSARSRLQHSLENKRNLISVDADEYKKSRLMREEVRKVVSEDLAKYNAFLREQRESKHVQLPMPMPESNPVPRTLGAISAAAEDLFTSSSNGEKTISSLGTPASGGSLGGGGMAGNASRISAFRLAGKVNSLLSSAGLSRSDLSAPSGEDGIIPLDNDDDNNNNNQMGSARHGNDDGNVPTKGYMAKLKAMLSYENARRRRLNRIKSKTYRRILRKEKDRENERRERAFEILHPEKARARLAEKLMKARMEERVTQKHKNTSKWVRHAKRFANFDGNTKDAINEQNLLHQQLMQKMEEDADEDAYLNAAEDGSPDSEASSEEERVVDYLIAEATANKQQEGKSGQAGNNNNKLTSLLWRSIEETQNEGREAGGGGDTARMTPTEKARADLRDMKFMQQAKQREEKRYKDVLDHLQEDILRDLRGEVVTKDDEPPDILDTEDEEKKKEKISKAKTQLSTTVDAKVGHRKFLRKTDAQSGREVVENIQFKRHRGIDARGNYEGKESHGNASSAEVAEDYESIKDDDVGDSNDGEGNEVTEKPIAPPPPTNNNNNNNKTKKTGQNKKDEFAGNRQSNISSLSKLGSDASSLTTTRKRTTSTRITLLPEDVKRPREEKSAADAEGESMNTKAKRRRKGKEAQQHEAANNGQEHEGDGKEEEREMTLQEQQDYLIARAFADDEVDADFLAEKNAQVETIMKPVDKNATLPGWGEWGGEDERLNKRHQAKLQAMDLQRQIEKSTLMKSRADADLDHVIINHDGVELVPDRMLLHMVPRPFSNPTEFARSMRYPLGPEWNSSLIFKDANQPRVEVRQGQAVLPLDLSLRGRKKTAKTKRRKTQAKATSA